MASAQKKTQLLKSVLDMKFMKKTKERLEKELQTIRDYDGLYSNIITNEMRQATGNFVSESSFIFCEDLLEGRISFKGMNPEIEKLMESEKEGNNRDEEMLKDVSDEVLAKQMSKKKRQRSPSQLNAQKRRK